MFYICGWQGTIDGTMDYLENKDFMQQREKNGKMVVMKSNSNHMDKKISAKMFNY